MSTNIKRRRKNKSPNHEKRKMIFFLGGFFLLFTILIIFRLSKGEEVINERAVAKGETVKEKKKDDKEKSFDHEEAVRGISLYDKDAHTISKTRAEELMKDYAECYSFDESLYNDDLKKLLMNHFEAREFVLNYPLHVTREYSEVRSIGEASSDSENSDSEKSQAQAYYPGQTPEYISTSDFRPSDVNLATGTDAADKTKYPSEMDYKNEIPHLYQWDLRWAYKVYGLDVMGLTGCGPTALSMVAMYLLQDPLFTPDYVAQFSLDEGYNVPGLGTSWELMTDGATKLGLTPEILNLDENQMAQALLNGKPIICICGEGDFTDQGHFIVISGYEGEATNGYYTGGKFIVNDPNCIENSNKTWTYKQLLGQVDNVWAYSKTPTD